ncbi:acid protease [Sistotremastrum niveocremeum HHB9708]|uniref:Acid protease n=1 Tax=Sistotremastrum niveocremeum HHB9708 TaxID=1314777 RepID=A0A165AB35_9AGAM|nr:acid protease [Sistotremastrum niveocremeum HHB9708]
MAKFYLLFSVLCTASVVFASPVVQIRDSFITVPIARKFAAAGSRNFVEADRARALALISRGKANAAARARGLSNAAVGADPVSNQAVTYFASVGVGSPPTQYELIVDTGSSNTWIGANKSYVKTSTSVDTENAVSVSYGSGSFSGTEYLDTVTLAPGLVIENQSIGVASTANGFEPADGILGLGPVDLTEDTVANTQTVPTVTDNLFAQGAISSNVMGISFEPTTADGVTNGEIAFGGIDSSKFTGSINYAPTTSSPVASKYWGIDQSISYGSGTLKVPILLPSAGIVDTGTTLILLSPGAYALYLAVTGAIPDQTTGFLKISNANLGRLQNLNFKINGVTYVLTPNAQLWPHSLNTLIGGKEDANYLIVADIGTAFAEGIEFVNGYTFLERFYSVYDTTNRRVGFATTPFTNATTN